MNPGNPVLSRSRELCGADPSQGRAGHRPGMEHHYDDVHRQRNTHRPECIADSSGLLVSTKAKDRHAHALRASGGRQHRRRRRPEPVLNSEDFLKIWDALLGGMHLDEQRRYITVRGSAPTQHADVQPSRIVGLVACCARRRRAPTRTSSSPAASACSSTASGTDCSNRIPPPATRRQARPDLLSHLHELPSPVSRSRAPSTSGCHARPGSSTTSATGNAIAKQLTQ
jgi:hypothetical protein